MSNKANFKLSDIKKAHFIGVGGIGMSALARLFLNEKKQVSGSDKTQSGITRTLQSEGVQMYTKQVAENISGDVDVVVYTEAMPHDHEELVAARKRGIVTVNYFDALGTVANEYYLIAVAGTHGKTTTTAMIADIFEGAELDPTVIVGSLRSKTQSNYRAGKSKYMVVEACEYKRDFLSLTPDVLVITNLEHEHVDYYKNLYDVQMAFREFASQVRDGGVVIFNRSDKNVYEAVKGVEVRFVNYGTYVDPLLNLKQPGLHNQLNAAAATAAAASVEVSPTQIRCALEDFAGTWRRFEYKGEMATGSIVIDDYSHHPTEIRAAIAGTREKYPHKNIVLVHEPHTYSRTHEFFNDFVEALSGADQILLLPIYAAREENTYGVSSEKMSDAIGKKSTFYGDSSSVIAQLRQHTSKEDVVLVVGAGNVTEVAQKLTK